MSLLRFPTELSLLRFILLWGTPTIPLRCAIVGTNFPLRCAIYREPEQGRHHFEPRLPPDAVSLFGGGLDEADGL